MKHISMDYVEPGHVMGKAIYSYDGKVLLSAGIPLTPGLINKLRNMGVTMIYIQDKEFADVKINDIVSDETRRDAINNLSIVMERAQQGRDFETKQLGRSATSIIDEMLRNRNMLLQMSDIRTKDNSLFVHSLNVCMMSVFIGVNLGYTDTQLKEVAIGALLHDVGKVVKENDSLILNRPKEQTKHHSWIGFNLLRQKHEISLASAHVALQHHEHVNGSGTPRALTGNEIHEYGKIVAVANYYDNLISGKETGHTQHPFEAAEYIMGLAESNFDHKIVREFLRSIAMYPTGSSVRLSDNSIGLVVGQHKGLPARPIVRVIKGNYDNDQYDSTDIKEIDLAKATTMFITSILAR